MFFKYKRALTLLAPCAGQRKLLEEVKDPVFSNGMMGKGFAVVPTDGEIFMPVNAKITNIFPTKHALGMETKQGVEILLHLGVDTVELQGEAFDILVEVGQELEAGTKIIQMDVPKVIAAGKETDVLVLLTNQEQIKKLTFHEKRTVAATEAIAKLSLK